MNCAMNPYLLPISWTRLHPVIWMGCFLVLVLTPTVNAEPTVKRLGKRQQGSDWPIFLGPTADSRSTETGITAWPASGPRLVWSRPLTESYGIGSVSQGRYYQFDYANGRALLDCLESETGEPIWQFSYPSKYTDTYGYNRGPRCSPVIDDNRVYIYGAEGMLHCLDAVRGTEIWKVDVNRKFGVVQNFFGVGSSPVIHQDLLIVMVGGSPAEDQTIPPGQLDRVSGNGTGIVAFEKLTGKVRYQLSDDLASYAGPRIVKHGGRDWGFMFLRAGLTLFNPTTGKQDDEFPWRARLLESVNASTPIIVDDMVFISETYGPGSALLRFGNGKLEPVWQDNPRQRQKSMQAHWNTPVYHDGFLYGSSGRHSYNAELRCIELKTGKVRWSQPRLTRCSLLYVDEHLVCLGEDGTLRLLKANPEKYEVVSTVTPTLKSANPVGERPLLKYPAWAAPILSHGLMYVRGADYLACYDLIPVEQ